MTLAALRSDATVKKTLTLSGPKAWTVPEVIELCEKLADERAQVTQVSIVLCQSAVVRNICLWWTSGMLPCTAAQPSQPWQSHSTGGEVRIFCNSARPLAIRNGWSHLMPECRCQCGC